MAGFETFEIELQNYLNNLYNPAYQPAALVYQGLNLEPSLGSEFLRGQVIQAISELGAPGSSPPGSKSSFICQLLHYRFVQSLSQEKASEILDISTRHFRRKQREAIHALALHLWEKHQQTGAALPEEEALAGPEDSHIAEIVREITVLTHSSPGITTNLEHVLKKAVEMAGYLQQEHSLQIAVQPLPGDLELPLHPTVLRQIVLYILLRVIQSGFAGCLTIGASQREGEMVVSFSAGPGPFEQPIQVPDLIDLLPALGGKIETASGADGWRADLLFSPIARVKVLVIDDNLDQIHLYRRMLAPTSFEVVHLASGENLHEQLAGLKPDLILMDILLPGIDGWDLLLQIRQNPATARIPVVISSVMGNESMAKSLGANAYLPKSADRKTFLQTLEQVYRER